MFLEKLISWFKAFKTYGRMSDANAQYDLEQDPLFWHRDLVNHAFGEFSFAVVRANERIEDESQVEIGRDSTFIGVYDGHGGHDEEGGGHLCSDYVSKHLVGHVMRYAHNYPNRKISEDVLTSAFVATEFAFLNHAQRMYLLDPQHPSPWGNAGSCCLVGVIWRGTLYAANVGDSRAVIGSLCGCCGLNKIVPEQINREHNARFKEVRKEQRNLHPDEENTVTKEGGVWLVRGIIQVSRAIGDAYLKGEEYTFLPPFPRYHVNQPTGAYSSRRNPVLSAKADAYTIELQPHHKFVIFASQGLWDHLYNEEAVNIVHHGPREGIAKLLLKVCMIKAAAKRNIRELSDLSNIPAGKWRDSRGNIHDDITIVVMFINHDLLQNPRGIQELPIPIPEVGGQALPEAVSVKGFSQNNVEESNFNIFNLDA